MSTKTANAILLSALLPTLSAAGVCDDAFSWLYSTATYYTVEPLFRRTFPVKRRIVRRLRELGGRRIFYIRKGEGVDSDEYRVGLIKVAQTLEDYDGKFVSGPAVHSITIDDNKSITSFSSMGHPRFIIPYDTPRGGLADRIAASLLEQEIGRTVKGGLELHQAEDLGNRAYVEALEQFLEVLRRTDPRSAEADVLRSIKLLIFTEQDRYTDKMPFFDRRPDIEAEFHHRHAGKEFFTVRLPASLAGADFLLKRLSIATLEAKVSDILQRRYGYVPRRGLPAVVNGGLPKDDPMPNALLYNNRTPYDAYERSLGNLNRTLGSWIFTGNERALDSLGSIRLVADEKFRSTGDGSFYFTAYEFGEGESRKRLFNIYIHHLDIVKTRKSGLPLPPPLSNVQKWLGDLDELTPTHGEPQLVEGYSKDGFL